MTLNMKRYLPVTCTVTLTAFVVLAAVTPASGSAGTAYLQPHVKVGEQFLSVFSKAVSIKGAGFKEVVGRTSGTAQRTVVAADSGALTLNVTARYDGRPVQTGVARRLRDGVTDCWNDKCAINDSTSGLLFNRYLWGHPPKVLRTGTAWMATISKPWEIGPPGTERVRVVRVGPANHEITLIRQGSGNGHSSDDKRAGQISITTTAGKKIKVTVIPGESHWSGYTTVRSGIIIADEIMVERHVTLVSKNGKKFEGEQRTYTLENLAQDTVMATHAAR